MKKLCENIEDIHIRGDIGQLSDIVRSMDMSLQNIADNTDKLTEAHNMKRLLIQHYPYATSYLMLLLI